MHRPVAAKALLFPAALAGLIVGLGACSPARLGEAARVLADIDAGDGPSALKASTPPPLRRPVAYAVDGRRREGDLYLPGEPPLAAMVLVPGLSREGKDDRRLVAFASTLARARFEVLVPDLPRLRDQKVSPEDAIALADASRYVAGRAPERPTGMTAISYAVGPAVASLFEPGAEGRIDFVVAIGGYYDVESTLAFFTTGFYREGPDGPWRYRTPNDYGKWVFVRSNADRLADEADRALLALMAERKLDDIEADVDGLAARLGPEGRSVYALLENDDPKRIHDLIAGLPAPVRDDIGRLDLKRLGLAGLKVRFLLVHGRDDPIIPETESRAFAAALPEGRARLYVLDSLNHVDPRPSGLFDRLRLLRAIHGLLELRDRGPSRPSDAASAHAAARRD